MIVVLDSPSLRQDRIFIFIFRKNSLMCDCLHAEAGNIFAALVCITVERNILITEQQIKHTPFSR